jgi:hypothetical protein
LSAVNGSTRSKTEPNAKGIKQIETDCEPHADTTPLSLFHDEYFACRNHRQEIRVRTATVILP